MLKRLQSTLLLKGIQSVGRRFATEAHPSRANGNLSKYRGYGSPGCAMISVAPMLDVTDRYFLELLRILAPVSPAQPSATNPVRQRYAFYTEMHYARKITRLFTERGEDGLHNSEIGPPCARTVVQLGGSDPDWIADAYEALAMSGYGEVNLNLGCPSSKVQAGNFGAVLMKTPDQVRAILCAVEARRRSVPFTVKCRIGVDDMDSDEELERFIYEITTEAPLAHVIFHARKAHLSGLSPKKNRHVPPINYARVHKMRQRFPQLHITVNGGISSVDDVREQLAQVDGVMLGRKFRENPLFIQQLDSELFGDPTNCTPNPRQIIDEYLARIESYAASLTRPTVALRPLQMVLPGQHGRIFRRWMQQYLSDHMTPDSWSPRQLRVHVLAAVDEILNQPTP